MHIKSQIMRELDRLELLLEQIAAVESERNSLLSVHEGSAHGTPAAMLLASGVLELSLPPFSGARGYAGISTIGDRWLPTQA